MGPLTQLAVKVIHEELGLGVDDARSRYLASTGADFARGCQVPCVNSVVDLVG
jgi:hypothetical protein